MLKIFRKGKRSSVVYAAITFVVLMIITQLLVYQRHRAIARNEYNELVLELDDTKDKLNIALNHNISTAKTLAIMYRQDPSLSWFDDVAKDLVEMNDVIDAVEVVDKNFVITHIYPKKGNEHMIGFNVMSEPRRRKETLLALKDKTIKFSGPYELLQGGGGLGIAGRLPVYEGDTFIGGAVVLTRLSTIRKRMPELGNKEGTFVYQLSKVNSLTGKTEYFFDGYDPQKGWEVSKFMRRANWTLHVAYANGYISHWTIYLLVVFGVLFSAMGALFVYMKTYEAHSLDLAVKAKTRDLDERVKELSAIYQVDEALRDERQSMDIALSRVAKIIPGGFRYSDKCQARIVIGESEYATGSFTGTLYQMQAPMNFDDDRKGFIEVAYVKEEPLESEGPFLKEERALLNTLAETVEVYYNKKISRDRIARSEATLRSLVEACPVGVLLIGKDYRILAVNSMMAANYPINTGRSISVGDNFLDKVLPERRDYVSGVINEVMEGLEPITYDTAYPKGNETVYFTVSVAPVAVNGEAIGVCLVGVDITGRKRLELEHERIIRDLMAHMDTLIEFARYLADKVGESALSIPTLADQAKLEKDEGRRAEKLEDIREKASNIGTIVKQLEATLKAKNA